MCDAVQSGDVLGRLAVGMRVELRILSMKMLVAVLVSSLGLAAWAQTPAEPAPAAGEVQKLKMGQMEALRAFEAGSDDEYDLGEGDEIYVEVIGHPELSTRHIIGPDGKISIPVAGSVEVKGLSREAAAGAINKSLTAFYNNVSATVRVEKYGSNRVVLLGQVGQPGVMYFERTPTLLEVLTRGGAFGAQSQTASAALPTATGQMAAPPASKIPKRCAIFRGNQQAAWVELRSLLDSGSPLADLRLKRNDIVYVPADQDDYVSVMGEVQHPGVFRLDQNKTVMTLLAEAGGFTDKASKGKILLVQYSTGTSKELSFNDLLRPGNTLELTLKNGDVLYVPQSGFAKTAYVFEKLAPMGTLLMFGAVMGR